MAVETFGSGIKKEIQSQLQARAEVVSGIGFNDPTSTENAKTRENLLSINSNTGWVKVRSSAAEYSLSAPDLTYTVDLSTVKATYNSDLARNNVLGGNDSAGVVREGEPNSNPAYINTNSRGFRPKPGITGINVSTKNTYGTLREAEISLTIWSLEDLELYEKLYFRPGFSILVEWGHSYYIDNNKKAYKSPSTVSDESWFSDASIEKIEEEINKKRNSSSYNYDGFYGYVYNFSWNFRPDGGFDCILKVVSKGLVLESIKSPKTKNFVSLEELENKDSEKSLRERKSLFHFFFTKFERVTENYPQFNNKNEDYFEKYPTIQILDQFEIFRHSVLMPNGIFSSKSNLYYIKLKTLLDIFNYGTLNAKKNSGNNQFSTDGKLVSFDTTYGERFITFDNHYSLEPAAAVPPTLPATEDTFKKFTLGYKKEWFSNSSNQILTTEDPPVHVLMQRHVGAETDDIMNIMISTKMVEEELDKTLDGPQDEGVGFFDALKGVLSRIQAAFGEINKFNIIYDEETNLHRVVDRNILNELDISKEDIPIIPVTGLKSTVVNLNVSSKISNQLASQISIAAQGAPGAYESNVSGILKWNNDVRDRHIPYRASSNISPTTFNSDQDNEFDKNFLTKLEAAYDTINTITEGSKRGTYNQQAFESIRQEGISDIQKRITNFKKSENKEEKSIGTIPVELQIKMLGISGLKVGNTFRITKNLLPSRYDDWGYIITGLSHTIENGKWYTDIKTQFYKL